VAGHHQAMSYGPSRKSALLTRVSGICTMRGFKKGARLAPERGSKVERFKKCAACRYCRVHTAITTGAVLLAGSIISIVMLFDGGM